MEDSVRKGWGCWDWGLPWRQTKIHKHLQVIIQLNQRTALQKGLHIVRCRHLLVACSIWLYSCILHSAGVMCWETINFQEKSSMNQGDFFVVVILISSPYLWILYKLIYIIEEIIHKKFVKFSKIKEKSKTKSSSLVTN